MAWTFTQDSLSPAPAVGGPVIYGATTDASSAAGTVNPGFTPRAVWVYDSTNANVYHWNNKMAAGSYFKTVSAGTTTYTSSNGFTPVTSTGSNPVQQGLTVGTGIHTNSSTYTFVFWP